MDGHYRDLATDGKEGSTATELLSPPVWAASAFRVEQDAPPVIDQVAGHVCGLAAHLGSLDRHGTDGQRRDGAAEPVSKKVVSRRADHYTVAPWFGDRGEQQGRVGMAVVVGHEDHGPV